MPKTRKIALILAGGVSLGAYQAGVLTEFVHALEAINRSRDERNEPRIVVDVVTGASAGSMSGALFARMMMCGLDNRRGHLHDAWVNDIDILGLLSNIPSNALLSKEVIWEIANKYIVEESNTPRDAAASFAPDSLSLSFTLSNMHGIDYAIPNPGRAETTAFASTFFSDVGRFEISASNLDDKTYWKTVVEAALASGNFPIVFSPQSVSRTASDYEGSVQAQDGYFADGERTMSFLDGGMFNNEPLREAVHLAASVDGGSIDADRLFILVDPNINQSRHMAEVKPDDPLEKLIGRMAHMVRGESTARDWLRTTRVNIELSWRDQLLDEIAGVFAIEAVRNSNEIADKLEGIAKNIYDRQRSIFGASGKSSHFDDEIESLRAVYRDVYPDLTLRKEQSSRSAMFLNFTYILNSVADLSNKSRINLTVIGADKNKTAGDQLNSFGGFFEKDWREHDYRVGRIEATSVLPTILGENYDRETDATGSESRSYNIPGDWAGFPNVGIDDANRDLRKEFRSVIIDRSNEVMQRIKLPGIIRLMLRIFLKRKLSKMLKLR